MQISTDHRSDYTVLALAGRLNMVHAPKLRQAVAETVAEGHTRLAVDLSGVEFLDSSGLGALIGCLKLARQAGGDLRIAGITPQVRMVLELTSMYRVLHPYETVEAAFADA